jgi:hypothetical protein
MKASFFVLSVLSAAAYASAVAEGLHVRTILQERGEFPKGAEKTFMRRCLLLLKKQGVKSQKAQESCKCGADAIKANFTDKEIDELDNKTHVDEKLVARVDAAIEKACNPKEEGEGKEEEKD